MNTKTFTTINDLGSAADIALADVDGDTLRIVTAENGTSAALHSEILGCWLPATDARDNDNSIGTPADWQDPAVQFDTAAAAIAAAADPQFWGRQPSGAGQLHAVASDCPPGTDAWTNIRSSEAGR